MNSITHFALMVCLLLFISSKELKAQQFNPQAAGWAKGPSERFTGDVWVDYMVNDTINDLLVSKVLFEPHARSNWHYHLGKQIILAVDGEGYYKEKGKPMRKLKKGDVVVIEPGTVHSHGSIHSVRFIQAVMMNGIGKQNSTTWLEKVTDEEIKQ